jgi:hypothetical protein
MKRLHLVLTCLLSIIAVQIAILLVAIEGSAQGRTRLLVVATLVSALAFAAAGWVVGFIFPIGGPDADR